MNLHWIQPLRKVMMSVPSALQERRDSVKNPEENHTTIFDWKNILGETLGTTGMKTLASLHCAQRTLHRCFCVHREVMVTVSSTIVIIRWYRI